jgi:hypothetical protein
MTIVSMTGDGERLFVYPGGDRAITAIDAATGSVVPGWGAQLPAARARGEILGVARPRVLAWAGEFFGEGSVRGDLIVAQRDDRRVIALRSTGQTSAQLVELVRP